MKLSAKTLAVLKNFAAINQSFVVKPGDVVAVREASKNNPTILHARDATAHAPAPNWLDVDRENLSAKVVNQPKREDLVQIQLNEQLIVELYSK